MWAVLGPDPFYGYYAGYHDIWYTLQPELTKIGIDLSIYIQGDMYDNWYLIWEAPLGGRPPGKPPSGWDLTSMEWWIHPHGFLWMDGIILADMLPPYGFNVGPYLSEENDELYNSMQTNYEADVRKSYALEWQEYSMHNPQVLNWYYPQIYQTRSKYIQGWYFTTWWYEISNLFINQSVLDSKPPSTWGQDNFDRLNGTATGEKTIIYGVGEAWWAYLNLYCDSYTEETYQNLVTSTLYGSSLDPWPPEDGLPSLKDFTVKPKVASGMPQNRKEFTDPVDGEEVVSYAVPLRQGVKWSDGVDFDAEDVVFSHNYVLDKLMLSTAYGDFAPIVKRVEYSDSDGNKVDSPTPGSGYNASMVRYVLYDDYVDLPLVLANTWGAGIMPKHYLEDIPRYSLRNSPESKMFGKGKDTPSLGPYIYWAEGTPSGYSDITFKRNPLYFGYNASIVNPTGDPDVHEGPNGELYWGPYDIEYIILKYLPDAETRFAELERHNIDFGEYPTASVETFEGLDAKYPGEFRVKKAPYVASNDVWINFNHPALSNRYVRLAIAYATPYGTIFSEILPSWGIVDPIPPKSWVLPWSVYTEPSAYGGETVTLYNTEIPAYTYDLTLAQKYMDMYTYSSDPVDYALGPVGDANFDGEVGLRDVWLTLDEIARAQPPLTRTIDWWNLDWSGGTYPWPITGSVSTSSAAPGNDVDADFNNDGAHTIDDLDLCTDNWGKEYPEGAVW